MKKRERSRMAAAQEQKPSVSEQLKDLVRAHEEGLLSDEELEAAKARELAGL
jgi:hypothetical protein